MNLLVQSEQNQAGPTKKMDTHEKFSKQDQTKYETKDLTITKVIVSKTVPTETVTVKSQQDATKVSNVALSLESYDDSLAEVIEISSESEYGEELVTTPIHTEITSIKIEPDYQEEIETTPMLTDITVKTEPVCKSETVEELYKQYVRDDANRSLIHTGFDNETGSDKPIDLSCGPMDIQEVKHTPVDLNMTSVKFEDSFIDTETKPKYASGMNPPRILNSEMPPVNPDSLLVIGNNIKIMPFVNPPRILNPESTATIANNTVMNYIIQPAISSQLESSSFHIFSNANLELCENIKKETVEEGGNDTNKVEHLQAEDNDNPYHDFLAPQYHEMPCLIEARKMKMAKKIIRRLARNSNQSKNENVEYMPFSIPRNKYYQQYKKK